MLKNSASFVLALLRDSTYRSVRLASSFATALTGDGRVLARRGGWVKNDSLFEHPVGDRYPIGAPRRSTDRSQIARSQFVTEHGCFTLGGR